MLRHVNERRQPVVVSRQGTVDRLTKHPTPMVIREKRMTLVTGKRQLVVVPRFVIMANAFSMWSLGRFHTDKVTRQSTAGQASSGTRARSTDSLNIPRQWSFVSRG
jgi:hypothetical protein